MGEGTFPFYQNTFQKLFSTLRSLTVMNVI